MTMPGPTLREAAVTAVVAALTVITGCAGTVTEVTSLEVAFVIELQEGQEWTASGPAVDADLMCEEGQRRWLRAEDPVGRQLTQFEIGTMEREAQATREDPPLVLVNEWICADGRGSFTSRDPVFNDTWAIDSGRGSLTGLSGEGTVSFVETLEAIPEFLYMDSTLILREP